MDWKSSTQSVRFFYANLPIENFRMSEGSEFNNFSSSNFGKFAVECNWNSKVFEIRQNTLLSFEKNLDFFQNR